MADDKTEAENRDSEQRRFEFNFPIFTVRTKLFSGVFDRLGTFRFSRWLSWAALVIVPFVAGIGLYLLINGLVVFCGAQLLLTRLVRLGPQLLFCCLELILIFPCCTVGSLYSAHSLFMKEPMALQLEALD